MAAARLVAGMRLAYYVQYLVHRRANIPAEYQGGLAAIFPGVPGLLRLGEAIGEFAAVPAGDASPSIRGDPVGHPCFAASAAFIDIFNVNGAVIDTAVIWPAGHPPVAADEWARLDPFALAKPAPREHVWSLTPLFSETNAYLPCRDALDDLRAAMRARPSTIVRPPEYGPDRPAIPLTPVIRSPAGDVLPLTANVAERKITWHNAVFTDCNQASVAYLEQLILADGHVCSLGAMKKVQPLLESTRPDRLRDNLPAEIRDLIEVVSSGSKLLRELVRTRRPV